MSRSAARRDSEADYVSEVAQKLLSGMTWLLGLLGISILGLNLVGFQLVSMQGASMQRLAPAGSLLIARRTLPERIGVGDIVVFSSQAVDTGQIAHRVIGLTERGSRIVATTKGDSNAAPDPQALELTNPVPRVVLVVPHIGRWVTPHLGWQTASAVAVLVLALMVFRAARMWQASCRS